MAAPVDFLGPVARDAHAIGAGANSTLIRNSVGAVLLGSLLCMFLSGLVTAQTFLYVRLYPKDKFKMKFMVYLIWFLDIFHSAMASAAVWTYLIVNFGVTSVADYISWTIAVTVAITALVTFLVQGFFAHRIFTLSRGNWFIAGPIALFAFFRLVAALVSMSEMIRLREYTGFVSGYSWVFTLGLSLGAALDVVIAAVLCMYLRRSRTGFSSMDHIIDSITLYTIENGLLTCITTIASLICWLAMSHNLIFLGLHLAITKLYANSFLATLNARKSLLDRSQGSSDRGDGHALPVLFPSSFSRRANASTYAPGRSRIGAEAGTKLQINVEKTIQHDVDMGVDPPSAVYTASDPPELDLDLDDMAKHASGPALAACLG